MNPDSFLIFHSRNTATLATVTPARTQSHPFGHTGSIQGTDGDAVDRVDAEHHHLDLAATLSHQYGVTSMQGV